MSDPMPGDCSWCKWAHKLPGKLGYDYVTCGNEKSPVYYQVLFEHYNRCGVFEPETLTDDDIAKVLGSSAVMPLKQPDGPLGWMGLLYQIRDRLLRKQYYKENKREHKSVVDKELIHYVGFFVR